MIVNPDADVYTNLKSRKHPEKRKKNNDLLKTKRTLNVS